MYIRVQKNIFLKMFIILKNSYEKKIITFPNDFNGLFGRKSIQIQYYVMMCTII